MTGKTFANILAAGTLSLSRDKATSAGAANGPSRVFCLQLDVGADLPEDTSYGETVEGSAPRCGVCAPVEKCRNVRWARLG